ncbi:AraC family transcriptional regulator [Blautia schinkii]|nr:AraC family transcriptional regulator [Blautia schinkii]
MDKAELDQYIRRYTPGEEEYLAGCPQAELNEKVFEKFRVTDQGAYLFESVHFMAPGEKIVVSRQDRFSRVRPHKHDYIELCYVWSGICVQEIEGKKVTTLQGDVCIFDTQAVHSLEAGGENDIVVNILMKKEFFDAAFLSRMTRQGIVSEFLVEAVTKSRQSKHFLYFAAHKNPRIQDIMEHIMMEYYGGDLGMQEVLESYVIILFTELLRTWRDDSRQKDSVSQEVQILELLGYIEENYEHCTLPEMGKAFGMHGNYLTALLKEKTDRSFVEHVQEQKLKKARALLENTDIPMSELVPMCGYNNINFFYKKFKESEGCTPAKYRKDHRNKS